MELFVRYKIQIFKELNNFSISTGLVSFARAFQSDLPRKISPGW